MRSITVAAALSAVLPLAYAQTQNNETVLGVYMFHRLARTPPNMPSILH